MKRNSFVHFGEVFHANIFREKYKFPKLMLDKVDLFKAAAITIIKTVTSFAIFGNKKTWQKMNVP